MLAPEFIKDLAENASVNKSRFFQVIQRGHHVPLVHGYDTGTAIPHLHEKLRGCQVTRTSAGWAVPLQQAVLGRIAGPQAWASQGTARRGPRKTPLAAVANRVAADAGHPQAPMTPPQDRGEAKDSGRPGTVCG